MLSFRVIVVPRASKSEIIGEYDSALRVRIAAPPVDDAANEELVRVIAKAFGLNKSAVSIHSGQTSRRKEMRLAGVSADKLGRVLASKQIPGWVNSKSTT